MICASLHSSVPGRFQSVSSTTGQRELIHFRHTTPFANGAAALRGSAHNTVMTPQVKGRLASSSIKGRRGGCSRTFRRFCDKKGPEVTGVHPTHWNGTFPQQNSVQILCAVVRADVRVALIVSENHFYSVND